jgi:PhoPQ-activated pathogenicity-related protein
MPSLGFFIAAFIVFIIRWVAWLSTRHAVDDDRYAAGYRNGCTCVELNMAHPGQTGNIYYDRGYDDGFADAMYNKGFVVTYKPKPMIVGRPLI